jgi:phospholipase/carboxylesterase
MLYIEGNTLHKSLIDMPGDAKSGDKLPLVVGLHGGGGNPGKLINLWETVPGRKFIFAVPQAPYPLVDDGELMFDWALWPSRDAEVISKATQLSEAYIVDVVQELAGKYSSERVYLLGFSQGAIFTYLVGVKHSHLFEGLICLSGPGLQEPLNNPFASTSGAEWLSEETIRGAGNLRAFITHGNDDPAANHELGLRSRDILERHGNDVTFRDFDGGHSYPPQEILEEISDWIA